MAASARSATQEIIAQHLAQQNWYQETPTHKPLTWDEYDKIADWNEQPLHVISGKIQKMMAEFADLNRPIDPQTIFPWPIDSRAPVSLLGITGRTFCREYYNFSIGYYSDVMRGVANPRPFHLSASNLPPKGIVCPLKCHTMCVQGKSGPISPEMRWVTLYPLTLKECEDQKNWDGLPLFRSDEFQGIILRPYYSYNGNKLMASAGDGYYGPMIFVMEYGAKIETGAQKEESKTSIGFQVYQDKLLIAKKYPLKPIFDEPLARVADKTAVDPGIKV